MGVFLAHPRIKFVGKGIKSGAGMEPDPHAIRRFGDGRIRAPDAFRG